MRTHYRIAYMCLGTGGEGPTYYWNRAVRTTIIVGTGNKTYAKDSLLRARKTVKEAKYPVLRPIV